MGDLLDGFDEFWGASETPHKGGTEHVEMNGFSRQNA